MIKAVIPVAGVGTRLRPHTHTQPKPLIPLAGKPILGHIIDKILEAGITDFVFIIGYLGEKIVSFIEEKYEGKLNFEIVVQNPRKGLGHALHLAGPKFKDCDEILISLGDTIFDVNMNEFVHCKESLIGVQKVADPHNYGVAMIDENNYIVDASEKPQIPKSNLAMVGLYKIREIESFIQALETLMNDPVKENPHGEYHLTDGLKILIDLGVKLKTHSVENWFDCGKKESLLDTNKILLERKSSSKKAAFPGSVIIPPVFIGENVTIQNSIVGPYVSIDEQAIVKDSVISSSILGAYSRIDSIILKNSILGTDASLKGKPHIVNIGDSNQIDFNE